MDAPSPLRVVAPGERVTSPEVHIGMLFADLDDCLNAMHRHPPDNTTRWSPASATGSPARGDPLLQGVHRESPLPPIDSPRGRS